MIEKTLEDELQLKNWQVRKVIELIDEGSKYRLLQDIEKMLLVH